MLKYNNSLQFALYIIINLLLSARIYAMGVPESVSGVASVTAALGAPLKILVTAVEAARQGCEILKSIHDYFSSVEITKSVDNKPLKQRNYQQEEESLRKNPVLQIVEKKRLAQALSLLLIVAAPGTSFCRRIETIFTLNNVKLLGLTSEIFEKVMTVLNRHYFSSDGKIKRCDLPIIPAEELATFLRVLCPSDFELYSKQALTLEIAGIADYQSFQSPELRQNGVSPLLVASKRTNRHFLKIIGLCKKNDFRAAQQIIEQHKVKHNGVLCRAYEVMKHYYTFMLSCSTNRLQR